MLAIRNSDLSLLYPFMALTFVFVPLLAVLLFGEKVTALQVVGFLLIVGCLMDIFSAIVVVVPLILPISRVFGIATAACRDADNGRPFIEEAQRICGIRIDVLSGRREAELAAQLRVIEELDPPRRE